MHFHRTLACLILLASAFTAAGQGGVQDYRLATQRFPALSLSNPALMDSFEGWLAMVEAQFQKADGAVISLTESPNSWQAGAETESYCRISPRIAFFGHMDWQYRSGKDMGGQILMDPDYNPVNFLESGLDSRGGKHREQYSLQGGMSYRLGRRWAAGVRVNYTSADQTKVKDPRFSNSWMDLDAQAGVSFKAGEHVLLGASILFQNTLEQVKGGIYGTTERQYFIFTDKGGFLGTVSELAGDYNAISVNNYRPMMNYLTGAALQVAVDRNFAGELWFQFRNGYYGRKSSTTATFFEFDGYRFGYKGSWVVPTGENLHRLGLNASAELLNNRENKIRYVTPTGQNTVVEYLGQDLVLQRSTVDFSLDYAWHKDANGHRPSLSLGAKLDGRWKAQTADLFPISRTQRIGTFQADAYAQKTFPAGRLLLTLELHALSGGGFGTPREDVTDPSASSTSIKSYDEYLNRQYEYETAFRAGGEMGITVSMPQQGRWMPYVRLSDRYVSLLQAPSWLDGRGRNVALLSLGCSF